jgi:hypothetical protein
VRGAVVVICLLPLFFVVGLRYQRSLTTILQRTEAGVERRPSVALATERAPVWMNIGKAERYRDIDKVVAAVRELTEPGEKVFGFPSLDIVSFLADRDSPLRESRFSPRWIGRADEWRAVATMQEAPPRLRCYTTTRHLSRMVRILFLAGRFCRARVSAVSPDRTICRFGTPECK